MGDLSTLFAPGRVAVVGASETEGSVGFAVFRNLLDEFDGETIAVNPNSESIFDRECFDSLEDVPNASDIDVAVVVVPASVAVGVVQTAADVGIENIVVITAGFSESGSAGSRREDELIRIASTHDLNLVGPNSLGILSTRVGLNATFGPRSATTGNISFMSQSGAFITAVLDWAADRDVGFNDIVSLGNKAVLDEEDFIQQWGEDPETDVILGYLEDISDGRRFLETAKQVSRETPIVLVKSGRTEAGASAAASHTGAIAGSEAAYEAGLAQGGVLRVETVQELFDYASILSGQPLPESNGVAIITNAGGPGVMTTDAVGDLGLSLADFSDETLERLGDAVPEEASVFNPVDVLGDAPAVRFADAIDITLADPDVGMAIVLACPTATLSFDELARETVRLQQKHDMPVAATLMGGSGTDSAATILRDVGIPTYFDPARAALSLDALAAYAEIRSRERSEPTVFDVDRDRVQDILETAVDRGRTQLGVESMEILDAYGIETPMGEVVDSPGDAERVAGTIDGNVVMKIVSPDISHKSDIGGVEIDVPQERVRDTYEDIVVRAKNYQPDASIIGVQIQELVDLDDATETIIGVTRDPQFGPLVMFGLGGIFVEIMEDTAFRVAPVSESAVRSMIEEIQSGPLLAGARGRTPADVDALVEAIQRVAQLVTDFPAITELDINPAVAQSDGVTAIDLRLTLDRGKL